MCHFVMFVFFLLLTDVDDCASSPCRHNGTCVDLVADFVCRCVDGWKGRTCSNRNQHCQDGENPCLNGATCVDDSDPEAGFTCRCSSGWKGSICHLGKYRYLFFSFLFYQILPSFGGGHVCLDSIHFAESPLCVSSADSVIVSLMDCLGIDFCLLLSLQRSICLAMLIRAATAPPA